MDDECLQSVNPVARLENTLPTFVTNAIHLFKLSQLISEIKYIANSISHKTPPHTYPQIPDVLQWQQDMLARLQQWLDIIPQFTPTQLLLSEIRYHEALMLLLRPSPAIPNPSQGSLELCYRSAISVIRNFNQLYRGDNLTFTWQTLHSIFLAMITMLYCIWTIPSIMKETAVEILMADTKTASSVLSALAEHFADAKYGRDMLDELSMVTVQWIVDMKIQGNHAFDSSTNLTNSTSTSNFHSAVRNLMAYGSAGTVTNNSSFNKTVSSPGQNLEDAVDSESWEALFGMQDESNLHFPIDSFMERIFNDVQPDYEFGHNLSLDDLPLTDSY
jgi:hypothetical protein